MSGGSRAVTAGWDFHPTPHGVCCYVSDSWYCYQWRAYASSCSNSHARIT
jgi:hypothetical protein